MQSEPPRSRVRGGAGEGARVWRWLLSRRGNCAREVIRRQRRRKERVGFYLRKSMTGNPGVAAGAQACAACKFQRRKCSPECPLAPYFPADQPKQFLNVHRLYGVSNTLRILKQVPPSKRNDAMKSILYEANARDHDPVHGCLGLIALLRSQVEALQEELDLVHGQARMLEHQQHSLANYYLNYSQLAPPPPAISLSPPHIGFAHPSAPHIPANAAVPSWLLPYNAAGGAAAVPAPLVGGLLQGMDSPTASGIGGASYRPFSAHVKPSLDSRFDIYSAEEPREMVYQDLITSRSFSKDHNDDSSAESTSIRESQLLDHEELGSLFTLTAASES